MRPDFAPKGIGELLDAALALLRARWRTVFGSAAIALFPLGLIVGVLQSFYMRGFLAFIPTTMVPATEPPQELFEVLALANVVQAAGYAFALVSAFYTVALVSALPALLHGEEMTPVQLLKGGWRPLGRYVLAAIAVYAIVGSALGAGTVVAVFTFGLGLLVVVPVTLWLWARFGVATMASIAESAWPGGALKRSWALTSGRVWRVVGFYIGLGLLMQALAGAVSSPAVVRQVADMIANAPADNPFAALMQPVAPGWKVMEGFLYAAAATLTVPVGSVAWYLFYLDLRSRRDGMDLVLRARALAGDT